EAFECPPQPAAGYPKEYPIMDVLRHWGTDDAGRVPPKHFLSICRFDYQKEFETAQRYRDAEVPFIVYNVPALDETVKLWADPNYLTEELRKAGYRTQTERSVDNHFMYHTSKKGRPKGWVPPTSKVQMTYPEWLGRALMDDGDDNETEGVDDGADRDSGDGGGDGKGNGEEGGGDDGDGGDGGDKKRRREEGEKAVHYYFRVSEEPGKSNGFVARSVSFLAPGDGKSTLFLKDPKSQKGIHCRFGMHGVIAEAHHDGSRNAVAMVSGRRRWILAHPRNCHSLHEYPPGHPSSRHSAVDFSRPDLDKFPRFPETTVNEVILRAGEVLYVPTDWVHYIV
ncbi:unnamed protein product, partial [Phaeothamnion confervicola]